MMVQNEQTIARVAIPTSAAVAPPPAIDNTCAGLVVFIIGLLRSGGIANTFYQQPQCLELAELALTTRSCLWVNAPRCGGAPSVPAAELIAEWHSAVLFIVNYRGKSNESSQINYLMSLRQFFLWALRNCST